jgi:N-acetylglucosamine-6-sulfatase
MWRRSYASSSRSVGAWACISALVAGCTWSGGGLGAADDPAGHLPAQAVPAAHPMGVPSAVAAAAVAERPPNIVLITTDDQASSDLRWMPRTRRLVGDAGVTFANATANNPVCAPSRASLLTGQLSQNNGVHGNVGPWGGYRAMDNQHTVATWLHEAGYRTGFVGKYVNGYHGPPRSERDQPGWDSFSAITKGIYRYYGYRMLQGGPDGTSHWYGRRHSNDVIADRTADLVDGFAGEEQPFFIWSSYVAPHNVCRGGRCRDRPRPATRHRHVLEGVRSPHLAKKSFNEEDVSDKPRQVRSQRLVDPHRAQTVFTRRIQTLRSADEGIADTIRALARNGVLRTTLVVFASDNGFLVGEHRSMGKVLAYREALSVPLLMRGPGIPQRGVRRQLVGIVDLPATFAAIGGATPDLLLDGTSLLPYARQDLPQPPTTQLIGTAGNQAREWLYRGVRTHRYTYVEWSNGFRELYDHRIDRAEMKNRAGGPRHALEAALAERLVELGDCAGAACLGRLGPLPGGR